MLPVAFIRRAVESHYPVGVVFLLCPQVGNGNILAGVVVHQVAIILIGVSVGITIAIRSACPSCEYP